MSCRFDRDLLALSVGDELEPAEAAAVQQHLDGCAACRAVTAQYQAGIRLLQAPPATSPYRRSGRRRRRSVGLVVAAASLMLMTTATLSPSVRAAVTELLGFPSHGVREQVVEWHVAGDQPRTDANDIRLDQTVNPGPGERLTVDSAEQVRQLVGEDVLLPPLLPNYSAMLFRNLDEQGRLRYAELESIVVGGTESYGSWGWYEAQYWPNGRLAETRLTFGTNWEVRTEDMELNGLPARIIQGENRVTREVHVEIWLYQGDWLYMLKSHTPAVTVEMLRAVAGSLQ